jgi:ribosome recycling factor
MQDFKKKATEKMNTTIEVFKKDLSSIRTGRASLSLLEGVTVDYYGTPTPLNQVSTLGVPDPRQITIQPWDPKIIPDIEKAILKSNLGITPTNDGKIIRLNIPPLTEERRRELVKVAKKKAEDARIAVRNIRRDINEEIKKAEKEKLLSEDDANRLHDEVQKITDSFIAKIDDILHNKEKEIMEV